MLGRIIPYIPDYQLKLIIFLVFINIALNDISKIITNKQGCVENAGTVDLLHFVDVQFHRVGINFLYLLFNAVSYISVSGFYLFYLILFQILVFI